MGYFVFSLVQRVGWCILAVYLVGERRFLHQEEKPTYIKMWWGSGMSPLPPQATALTLTKKPLPNFATFEPI